MYADGEGLQWYDPALLFPWCPLSSDGGDDIDHDVALSSAPAHTHQPLPPEMGGVNSSSSIQAFQNDISLSPAAVSRQVRHRARELLLERLTTNTLSSDRDASASLAALVTSLHAGQVVHPTTRSSSSPVPPHLSTTAAKTSASPGVTRGAALRTVPTSLSGTQAARRRDTAATTSAPLHLLSTIDNTISGGEVLSELWDSDGEGLEWEGGEAGNAHAFDRADDYDHDDFALGGRGGATAAGGAGNGGAGAEARQARDLRAHFASVPTRLGVQEEPVLCPLDLHADPLTHVAAAAEVFAVVTSTLPQVLYVFDQLNNLPISSSVLGGATFAPTGDRRGRGGAGGDALPSSQQSPAAHPRNYPGDGTSFITPSSSSLPSTRSAAVAACTIDASDTVQQLSMDPTGYYCVLTFASGKCVYFYLPRRPALSASGAGTGKNGGGGPTAASTTTPKGGRRGTEEGEEDAQLDADGQRRRRERHREWRAAARRWLRFSRRRRSNSGSDEEGTSVKDVGVGGDGGGLDSDAAYRPRGFSLTCNVPLLRDSDGAEEAATVAASGGFVPSFVGWSQYLSEAQRTASLMAAAGAAAYATTAAAQPRGILKKGDRAPANAAATHHHHGAAASGTRQLAFKTDNADAAIARDVRSASATAAPPALAEVLLGAQRGGCLVSGVLTPTGAVDTRVVCRLPSPLVEAAMDSVVAICAPAAPHYGPVGELNTDEAREHDRGGGDANCGKTSQTGVKRSVALPPNGSAATHFPTYAHTPHFLSADEERRGGDEGPLTAAAAATAHNADNAGDRSGRHSTPWQQRRCRWVVLLSVRNRLYVFSTPSTTTDFSELEEIREASVAARAGMGNGDGGGVPRLRSTLSATAHRLTGRIEDAFLLCSNTSSRSTRAPEEGRAGQQQQQASLTTAPLPPARRSLPPLPTSTTTAAAAAAAGAAAGSLLTTAAPATENLHNFVVLEETSFSVHSRSGYAAAASQVRTSARDAAEATSAASSSSSAARGTIHVVLPPLPPQPSASAASADGNTCVTAATLPPVFYWQYGDVLVQGIVLCGAGGLEVGAKVRALVHQEARATAISDIASGGTSAHTLARRTGDVGSVHRTEVLPRDESASVFKSPPARQASGLEAGLSAMVEEALRETQDLNALAATAAGDADESGDVRVPSTSSAPPFGSVTGAVSRSDGSGVAAAASTNPTQATTNITTITATTVGGGGAASPPSSSSSTQPTVLPIGLLSVVNVNSCLQSLRALLALISAGQGDGQGGGKGPKKCISYTRCALRPSTTTLGSTDGVGVAANVATTAALPPGVTGVRGEEGSYAMLPRRGAEDTAALQASLTAALRHPALQFPFTHHLLVQPTAASLRGTASAEAGGKSRRKRRQEGGEEGVSDHLGSGQRSHHHHRHSHRRDGFQGASPLRLVGLAASSTFTLAAKDGDTSHLHHNTKAARRGGSGMAHGGCDAGDVVVDVPLLDSAVARGDIDATTLHRLRAVARAYIRRSPVLFDTPVTEVLRGSASVLLASVAAKAAAAAADVAADADADAQLPVFAADVIDVAHTSLSPRSWSPRPLRSADRMHSRAALTIRTGYPIDDVAAGEKRSRGSSVAASSQRHASSPALSADVRESGCRTDFSRIGAVPPVRSVHHSDTAAHPGSSSSRSHKQMPPPPTPSSYSGVMLSETGEVLISFSPSYTHLVFTTTQGVYVLAHAAVAPLIEAALAWRRDLVFHVVTAPTTAATSTPSAAVAAPGGGPLFNAVADPAAPDMFYLASRTRVARLQVTSLDASAAGRKQFVMQLLALAAATQQAERRDVASSSSPLALARTADATHAVFGRVGSGGSGGIHADDASGQRVAVGVSETVSDSSSNTTAGAAITVVVPSSLSYEVRLHGWRRGASGAAASAAVDGDGSSEEGDADALPFVRPHLSPRGTTISNATVVDADALSWRSSHASRSSSAQRQQRRFPTSVGGDSSAGTRSEAESAGPSPLGAAHLSRTDALEPPTLMLEMREQAAAADSSGGLLPRAQSAVAVGRLPAPVSGVAHFLRHANRRALPSRASSAASLTHEDSTDPALSPFAYEHHDLQDQQQGGPSVAVLAVPPAGLRGRGADVVSILPTTTADATQVQPLPAAFLSSGAGHSTAVSARGYGSPAGASPSLRLGSTTAASTLPHDTSAAINTTTTTTFTHFASPTRTRGTGNAYRTHAGVSSPQLPNASATGTEAAPSSSSMRDAHYVGGGGSAAAVAALGAASRAEDRELADFLRANPLLHYLLQRSGGDVAGSAAAPSASLHGSAGGDATGAAAGGHVHKVSPASATLPPLLRAVNIPGFGVLPGSVGLPPLAASVGSRAALSLLLQMPLGASYYSPDHIYEMALAATTSCARRGAAMTHEDVSALHLVRHTYGGYLLSQQRYVEAAVQFGKAAEGPTPFTTVVTELVRAFRASNCLEPLVLLLRLRLRAWEESAKGLGGHGMEVSVLATWLLSLCLEQCSVARAQRRQYAAAPADESGTRGEKTAGKRTAVEDRKAGKASTPNVRANAPRNTHVDGYAASSCSPDYTREAWIRRRHHLDHPLALLEDTLLRYGRFVDAAVLSKAVARLASAHEAVLVAELQGAPEETVTGLVLRQQNFFAGMLRLQALLVDPTSHAPQTRRLLHTLINADGREGGCDTRTGAATEARTSSTAAAASAGTLPLVSVFYGREAGAGAALPPPRDAAALPRTLAFLFERLTTLFLSCYPCRFVQEGLLVLLHQRQDVPLPPRRLLPALLTYTVACNENSFEATGSPAVVLQALALARQRQRLSLTYAAGSSAAKEKKRPKNKKEGGKGESALPTNMAAQHRHRSAAEQTGEAGAAAAVMPAALNTQSGVKKSLVEVQSERQQQQRQRTNNRSSSEADSLALSSPAPPSSPPLASSSSSSTTASSQAVSPHASHHETRAYPTNEASFLNHSAASLDEDAQADYDVVVLDDSGSEESGKAATDAIDEDIHLPPLPTTSDRVEGGMQKENSSLSSSGSDTTTSSSDTVTPSSPRRRGRPSHPHDGSSTSREGGTGSRAENGFTPLLLSDSRGASSTATSTSITERQGNRTEGNSGSGSRGRGEAAASYSSPIAAGSGAADSVRATNVPLLNASAATATTITATTSSTSDAVVDLLATSESYATEDAARTDDEEDFDEESDTDMEDDGFAPFIDMGDIREVEMQNATRDEARAHARVQRARQRRLSAALHLRQALVPPLSRAVVSAAVAHQTQDQDGEDAGDLSLQLLPVSEHAVLCYLKELVTLQGTSAPLADHSDTGDADGDVAVFVAYVNVLARDGEEETLQCFTEQLAQQHTQRLDNAVRSTASTYRLLHVLRLCAAHHRWVGCVWMYYALGHYQAAVELALHHVVGEEGVRLAVRLLQLLHERDGHRRLGGASGGGQGIRQGRSRGISPRFSSTFANTAARAAAPGADHTLQPDMQRSRRGLWMLVARHLIHGGGHTKHGAQTALQLSLRSGGDAFNVTDVLPELPGSLFMAELKAELLSSVRELAHRMRTLRTSTNALGRDSRVLHREVQSLSNQPLSMQVEDRCVLCGQPALARPFTVYPRCRHLIHTSCYHHARQAGLRRDGAEGTAMQPAQQPPFSAMRMREKRGSTQRASQLSTEAPRNGDGDEGTSVGVADFMECLLCARPSLRAVLDAPLDVAIVGDGVQQPHPRVVLR